MAALPPPSGNVASERSLLRTMLIDTLFAVAADLLKLAEVAVAASSSGEPVAVAGIG